MKQHAIAKQKGSRFRFIVDTISELKKVIWLSRREAIRLTIMVLAISMAVGLVLGALDYGFTKIVGEALLGGG